MAETRTATGNHRCPSSRSSSAARLASTTERTGSHHDSLATHAGKAARSACSCLLPSYAQTSHARCTGRSCAGFGKAWGAGNDCRGPPLAGDEGCGYRVTRRRRRDPPALRGCSTPGSVRGALVALPARRADACGTLPLASRGRFENPADGLPGSGGDDTRPGCVGFGWRRRRASGGRRLPR